MPLTGSESTLATALRAAILAKPTGVDHLNARDTDALTELCDALAASIVAHIVANAVVSPTTAGVPSMNAGPNPVTGVGELT